MPGMTRTLTAVAAALLWAVIAAPAAHAIDIQPVTSPLGIQACLVEDHSVQLISMNYAFAGGASQEPLAKSGITNLMVSLLDEGSGDLDSTAIQTVLEDLSISM